MTMRRCTQVRAYFCTSGSACLRTAMAGALAPYCVIKRRPSGWCLTNSEMSWHAMARVCASSFGLKPDALFSSSEPSSATSCLSVSKLCFSNSLWLSRQKFSDLCEGLHSSLPEATSFAYMSQELIETTLTCSAWLRNSMSSTMSSSAHLRVCSDASTFMMPTPTMSEDALPAPSRLRSVASATRTTFSLGTLLTMSTSLATRPTLEVTISSAASG
mmetsp:Transcript_6564/g.13177  ORF Transcript_6564/g.13177 Transcript_6564/m.13177 type:complete len:216 (+) Transcript_6564:291-938(+)